MATTRTIWRDTFPIRSVALFIRLLAELQHGMVFRLTWLFCSDQTMIYESREPGVYSVPFFESDNLFSTFTYMIRAIIRPDNTDIHISIPDDYVGRNLEVLLFATDEPRGMEEEKVNTMAPFRGVLSAEEADQLLEYVKKSRAEWNRDI